MQQKMKDRLETLEKEVETLNQRKANVLQTVERCKTALREIDVATVSRLGAMETLKELLTAETPKVIDETPEQTDKPKDEEDKDSA